MSERILLCVLLGWSSLVVNAVDNATLADDCLAECSAQYTAAIVYCVESFDVAIAECKVKPTTEQQVTCQAAASDALGFCVTKLHEPIGTCKQACTPHRPLPSDIGVASVGINAVVEENTPQNAVIASTCDCEYFLGGCKIVTASPAYSACDCSYRGGWTCRGDVVSCLDPYSPKCIAPDTSYEACMLGGGDCGGYDLSIDCDCEYSLGGCKITEAAPKYTACKCRYMGGWTCRGSPVQCNNEDSPFCANPTKNHQSCLLGGGDCGGYDSHTNCDCEYYSGGCKVTKAAPDYSACKCKYMGFWTCSGSVTQCRSPSSQWCANPDTSEKSCLLGGGDCGGY